MKSITSIMRENAESFSMRWRGTTVEEEFPIPTFKSFLSQSALFDPNLIEIGNRERNLLNYEKNRSIYNITTK